jgi:methenyltetrahydrofolate cyclohydrolase
MDLRSNHHGSTSSLKEADPRKEIDYLNYPTIKLLEEYGDGRHLPGSGSASALSGLIGLELLKTVCKLTLRQPAYTSFHGQLQFILDKLEFGYKPTLIKLFNDDVKIFETVMRLKTESENARDEREKDQLNRLALDLQKDGTYIPLEICKTCLEIIQYAITIFDKGFLSARGDAGVAISNLLAGISGALFVVFLNLKNYKESKWLSEITRQAETLISRYDAIHKEAFKRVMNLYTETVDENQLLLFANDDKKQWKEQHQGSH